MTVDKKTIAALDTQDYYSLEHTIRVLSQICREANDFVCSSSEELLLDISDIKTAMQILNEFFEMVRLSDALILE